MRAELNKSTAGDFAAVAVESLNGMPVDVAPAAPPRPRRRRRLRVAPGIAAALIKAISHMLKARRVQPARGEQLGLFGRPAPAAVETPAPAPVETPEPVKPAEYRYGAYNRPPGFGATPKGILRVDPPIPGVPETRHGVVVYPRPLTDDEVEGYELSPHLPVDEAVRRMADGLGEYADGYLDDADETGDDGHLRAALHDALHAGMARGRRHSDRPVHDLATQAIAELRRRRAAAAPPEPVKPAEYRYGAAYRPPGLGAVPGGYTRVDPPVAGVEQTRHGVIVYPRPLTDHEVQQFQLSPHVPRAELVDRLLASVGDKGAAYVAMAQRAGDGIIRSRFGKVFEQGNLHSDAPDLDVINEAVAALKQRHGPIQDDRTALRDREDPDPVIAPAPSGAETRLRGALADEHAQTWKAVGQARELGPEAHQAAIRATEGMPGPEDWARPSATEGHLRKLHERLSGAHAAVREVIARHQAPPEPRRTSDEVQVKQHLRRTRHGVQVVKQHVAHIKPGDAVPNDGLTPEAYAPHFLHAQELHRELVKLIDHEDQRREGIMAQRFDDRSNWSRDHQELEADVREGKPEAMRRALELKLNAENALAWAAQRAHLTNKRYQLERYRDMLDPDRRSVLKLGLPTPRDDAHAYEIDEHLQMGFRHARRGLSEVKGLRGDARAAYRVGRAEAKEHDRREKLIDQAERIAHAHLSAPDRARREALGKAGAPPAPGLELLPVEGNPRVRRWQRVEPHEIRAGATFQVRDPEHGDHVLHIRHVTPHEVGLAWGGDRHVWRSPPESVPQLVSDLRGEIHGNPTTEDPTVNAVLDGQGEWLGKGNDGIVHRVGAEVVKSATVAGYHPENGIRSIAESNQIIRNEHAAHVALAHHPLVPPTRLVEHEGRAHLVKPYLHPAGRLSRAEVEAAQDLMETAHHHGLVALDRWQFGRDDHGAIKIMDLGSARRSTSHSHREDDQMFMDQLWADHGHEGRNPKDAELEEKLASARLLLNMPLRSAEKSGRASEWLSSSWSRYRRLHDLKGVELLAQDRDDEWNALHDERDDYQRRIDAVHARAAASAEPAPTAAG